MGSTKDNRVENENFKIILSRIQFHIYSSHYELVLNFLWNLKDSQNGFELY